MRLAYCVSAMSSTVIATSESTCVTSAFLAISSSLSIAFWPRGATGTVTTLVPPVWVTTGLPMSTDWLAAATTAAEPLAADPEPAATDAADTDPCDSPDAAAAAATAGCASLAPAAPTAVTGTRLSGACVAGTADPVLGTSTGNPSAAVCSVLRIALAPASEPCSSA